MWLDSGNLVGNNNQQGTLFGCCGGNGESCSFWFAHRQSGKLPHKSVYQEQKKETKTNQSYQKRIKSLYLA